MRNSSRRYSRAVSSNVVAAALRLVRNGVEREVGDAQDGGLGFAAAPAQRADAGDQFGDDERLGQIIVRAGVEALDALVDFAARGQQQHRRGVFALAQLRAARSSRRGPAA